MKMVCSHSIALMNAGLLEPLYRIAFLLSGRWDGDRTYLLTSGLPSVFLQYDLTVFLNETNALGPVKRIVLRPKPTLHYSDESSILEQRFCPMLPLTNRGIISLNGTESLELMYRTSSHALSSSIETPHRT